MEAASIPILLVEDNPADAEIIRRALQKGGLSNPLHHAKDGQEAIDFLQRHSPGVLLLDIHLPKIDGIEVLKTAKRINPQTVVIMLTGHASLKTAVQSLRRERAFDYLEKSKDNLPKLIEAVRLALKKRAAPLPSRLVIGARGSNPVIDRVKIENEFGLSRREIDVIERICRGDTNKKIAAKLFISELTVKVHLKNIYEKMGVHNRTTLFSKVLANGAT
ncbi:MAG: response regulator transcription factor [Nitrospiria bacterium]